MGKKFGDLEALVSLADGDIFAVKDISEDDSRKMTASQLITYIESVQLDGLNLNEAVALTASSTEINSACSGLLATAAEINAAADGIGVSIPKVKVLTIGDWDMNVNASVDVAHGLTTETIVGAVAKIRDDSPGNNRYFIGGVNGGNDAYVSQEVVGTSSIRLVRETGGSFDTADFDQSSWNRGWIVVFYID